MIKTLASCIFSRPLMWYYEAEIASLYPARRRAEKMEKMALLEIIGARNGSLLADSTSRNEK